MKYFTILLLSLFITNVYAGSISGQLKNNDGAPVDFANVALYSTADSSLVKVEISDADGRFNLQNLEPGDYYIVASFIGFDDLRKDGVSLTVGQELNLGELSFGVAAVKLDEATVTASRAIIEVKPDRTVFNVQGTINSVGTDAISLLRKAPSVTVDNNNNISVLGRAGVLLYVDGKRLPLAGEDLSNYLENLPAEQIDRIDIITNPGARYEAEGNAGIIDIRLRRNESHGANGAVNSSIGHGEYLRYNFGVSGNYRNRNLNTFGSVGYGQRKGFFDMDFINIQNGLRMREINNSVNENENINYRVGTDFFLGDKHTIGFLVGGNTNDRVNTNVTKFTISDQDTPDLVDSILIANNKGDVDQNQNQFNINYRYDDAKAGRNFNIDLDYGRFENGNSRVQPNQFFDAEEENVLTEVISELDTPTDIDIYTAKLDYEEKLLGGTLGLGTKLSQVKSDNTFLFYNVIGGEKELSEMRSSIFDYDENVYAGYVSYARPINEKWNLSVGLRAEKTDAVGDLEALDPSQPDSLFVLNYLSWFPSGGITWQIKPNHSLALNYGKRINRPDYNVLNPFENQSSLLSVSRGNPLLNPESVHNIELGYTLNYRYNFKVAYSRTENKITRLIGSDDEDGRINYINYDNLKTQTVFSLNISAPVDVTEWWSAFFNFSASQIDNQADYGGEAIVDIQQFTYSIYQQHTFNLPGGFKGEVSGYYSGPGLWEGVFEYDENWGLDLGLQKMFLQDRLNVKVSMSDLFYQTGFSGGSKFDGLESEGKGNWDSRRISLSASYRFGNQNVKSRKRKTGIEDEAGRVGS